MAELAECRAICNNQTLPHAPFLQSHTFGHMSQTPDTNVPDVILNSIADGVFTVDDQWRITSFNRAAEQITGIPAREAIGSSCQDVFRANICDGRCALRKTWETGRSIVGQPISIVNQDGRRVPVSISTATLKDKVGRVIGGVETFRDLSQVEQLRKQHQERYTFADILGRSKPMRRLLDVLPRYAESSSSILIEGASGTGKELIARAIHDLSPRKDREFVTVSCGAMPDGLLESELFGHASGAVAALGRDKPRRFERAKGGTIFLSDITDLSPAIQMRFLNALEKGVFERQLANDSSRLDVRLIAATTQDIGNLVQEGRFREDLYYRINVVRLELPALRDRREDIPLLVEHFRDKFNRLQNRRIGGVSEEVTALLLEYDFPGNVRELENIVEHAFVLCRGNLIERHHLPDAFRAEDVAAKTARDGLTLRELEMMHIREAMRRNGGNRTATARQLGINPSTLFRKIKALDLELP